MLQVSDHTGGPRNAFYEQQPERVIGLTSDYYNGLGLNWSILRLAFVYGDGDGHLAAVPERAARFKWHPAKTFSLVRQRDVARAVELALTGVMDGRIVNIVDDAPTTVYEIASLVGSPSSRQQSP